MRGHPSAVRDGELDRRPSGNARPSPGLCGHPRKGRAPSHCGVERHQAGIARGQARRCPDRRRRPRRSPAPTRHRPSRPGRSCPGADAWVHPTTIAASLLVAHGGHIARTVWAVSSGESPNMTTAVPVDSPKPRRPARPPRFHSRRGAARRCCTPSPTASRRSTSGDATTTMGSQPASRAVAATCVTSGQPATWCSTLGPDIGHAHTASGGQDYGCTRHERLTAGEGGFEPPNRGFKVRCLTPWLLPIQDSA